MAIADSQAIDAIAPFSIFFGRAIAVMRSLFHGKSGSQCGFSKKQYKERAK
jgi:hypothetical protein